MAYDREIIRILTEAGENGLSIAKITRHVFNASNSFFNSVELEEVRRYVSAWLLKNSKSADSFIEKTERGIYRLNMNSNETSQLMLQFRDDKTEECEEVKTQEDFSLSLFD